MHLMKVEAELKQKNIFLLKKPHGGKKNLKSRSFCKTHRNEIAVLTVTQMQPYAQAIAFLWLFLVLFNRPFVFKTSFLFRIFLMSFILRYSLQANAVNTMVFKVYFPLTHMQKRGTTQCYGVKKKYSRKSPSIKAAEDERSPHKTTPVASIHHGQSTFFSSHASEIYFFFLLFLHHFLYIPPLK